MSKKLLKEETIRRFMKLADLKPLSSGFIENLEESGGKAGRIDRQDIANKASGRWLKEGEDEETLEEAEAEEETLEEAEEETLEEQEPPFPEEEPEEAPEEPGGGLETQIEDFIRAGAEAVGVDVEIGAGGEEAPDEEFPAPEEEAEEELPPAKMDYMEEGTEEDDLFEDLANKVMAKLRTENKKAKRKKILNKIDVEKLTERVTRRLAEEAKKKK